MFRSRIWPAQAPRIQGAARIVAAFVFMQSGTMKLFAFPIGMPNGGPAPPFTEAWLAGILEVFGGTLLALGLFTRPVAFILSGEMAVAYFQFHAPKSFWPVVNGGSAAILFCFLWLYFSAAGPGAWSLDGLRANRMGRYLRWRKAVSKQVEGFGRSVEMPRRRSSHG